MMEIKFRAWDNKNKKWIDDFLVQDDGSVCRYGMFETLDSIDNVILMQFTGLHDKNGLTDIYEGDIIDENGITRGNIYESPSVFRAGIDLIVTEMGTSSWRDTESIAMGRGCRYTE